MAVAARPRVSIITVNLDRAADLQRTLESVTAQRWDAIEQIVIDGGSSDGSKAVLEKFALRIASWVSEKDGGIYDAMNKGLARASGEHVLFLNSGDVLQGRVLHAGMDASRLLPVQAPTFWGRPRMLKAKDVRLGMPYCHQGILFRNDGLRPFDTSLRIAADYEFLLANLSRAGMGPPAEHHGGCVVFDTSGISNTRVRERDVEASGIILRR